MTLRDAVALSLLPIARQRLGLALSAAVRLDGPDPSFDSVVAALEEGGRQGLTAAQYATARARAGQLVERATAQGLVGLGWADSRYPALLREIPDPPPVLWVRGRVEALTCPGVAVVGSRAGTPYALAVAEQLGYDLASRGASVVSGLARGVDSAAHAGAVRAPRGWTVAVLGSGVDVIYPPEHRSLADEIVERGALVSELPLGSPPRRCHFPLRNRLISGLVQAVVIVEASCKSGSLITARTALDQGREVMAVPGSVLDGRNGGAHALIKDGAKLVETADDILEELRLGGPAPRAPVPQESTRQEPFWARLRPGEPYDLETLGVLSGLDRGSLLAELLRLEVEGQLARIAGTWIRLSERPGRAAGSPHRE